MNNIIWASRYFITSADYEEYPELTLREKTRVVIEQYRKELVQFYKKQGATPPEAAMNDNRFFIMWRNLPKTNIEDNTEDVFFDTLCLNDYTTSGEKWTNPDSIAPIYIHVRNAETLANGSLERFVERYSKLNKYLYAKPIILDLNFLPTDISLFIASGTAPELPSPKKTPEMSEDEYNRLTDLWVREFDRLDEQKDSDAEAWLENTAEERRAADSQAHFLTAMYENILKRPVKCIANKGFIYQYFQWQLGKTTAEEAGRSLGNLSSRTFYLYVADFESSPMFPEYQKVMLPFLAGTPRKGPLSFDLNEFDSDIRSICPDGKFSYSAHDGLHNGRPDNDYSPEYHLCEKYNIPTLLELSRTYLAVQRKLANQKKKERAAINSKKAK